MLSRYFQFTFDIARSAAQMFNKISYYKQSCSHLVIQSYCRCQTVSHIGQYVQYNQLVNRIAPIVRPRVCLLNPFASTFIYLFVPVKCKCSCIYSYTRTYVHTVAHICICRPSNPPALSSAPARLLCQHIQLLIYTHLYLWKLFVALCC